MLINIIEMGFILKKIKFSFYFKRSYYIYGIYLSIFLKEEPIFIFWIVC
jgi:hypothetical protein